MTRFTTLLIQYVAVVQLLSTRSSISVKSDDVDSSFLRTGSQGGDIDFHINGAKMIMDSNTTVMTAIPSFSQNDASVQKGQQRSLFFSGSDICPPPGFDAKSDFDIDLYLGRWYVQKQIPVAYQTVDQFYCVTATYSKDRGFCLFCNFSPRIDILNRARQDRVDGEKLGGPNRFFRGIIRRPRRDPAKITVGFFSQFLVRSNYWVVAAGLYSDILLGQQTVDITSNYEWAIITGGAPKKEGANGKCKPSPGLLNFLGMWLFVRDPTPAAGVVEAIELYANTTLGLDTTVSVFNESSMYMPHQMVQYLTFFDVTYRLG
jgi:lipocalin